MSRKPLRIAWFSPLNLEAEKSDSVSAYVSDELLPLLKADFEIECFIDGFGKFPGFETHHYLSAASHHEANPYDLFFYQIEDHPHSGFTRAHVGLHPGITLLHDLLFKLPGPEPFAFSPWRDTALMPHDETLPFPERLQAGCESRPVGKREATFSVVPIFSSSRNLDQYRREIGSSVGGDNSAYKLPFPVRPFTESPKVSVPGEIVVGFCGSPLIEHRAHKLLPALAKLPGSSLIWLLNGSELDAARELCGEFGFSRVEFVTERSPEKWREVTKRVDAAFHTLFSVFGAAGPYLDISMAALLPCIVTRFAEAEILPPDLLFKIPPGRDEAIALEESLALLKDRLLGSEMHAALRVKLNAYADEFLTSAAVAADLKAVFLRHADMLREFNQKWNALQKRARAKLLSEGAYRSTKILNSDPLAQDLQAVFSELGWQQ